MTRSHVRVIEQSAAQVRSMCGHLLPVLQTIDDLKEPQAERARDIRKRTLDLLLEIDILAAAGPKKAERTQAATGETGQTAVGK